MNNSSIKNLISKLTGRDYIIATNKYFKKITGDYNSANFLSQLIYWQDRSDNEWVYKSASDWHDELFLSPREVRTCKEKLENSGIITTKIMHDFNGIPKTHYQVNFDKLKELLFLIVENDKSTCRNRQIHLSKETSPLVGKDKSSYNIDYQHRLQTESEVYNNINNIYNRRDENENNLTDTPPPPQNNNAFKSNLDNTAYNNKDSPIRKKQTCFARCKNTFKVLHKTHKITDYEWTLADSDMLNRAIELAVREHNLDKNLGDAEFRSRVGHYLASDWPKEYGYSAQVFLKHYSRFREPPKKDNEEIKQKQTEDYLDWMTIRPGETIDEFSARTAGGMKHHAS